VPDETAKDTNNLTLSRLITKLYLDNFFVQNKAITLWFFIAYLTCFICANKLEIRATLNKMRLKAALVDLQPGLQNQTALDILFKFYFVKNSCLNSDRYCYKENRMFNVLGVGSDFI